MGTGDKRLFVAHANPGNGMTSSITTSKTPCRICGSYKIYSRSKACTDCRRRQVVTEMKIKYQPKPEQPAHLTLKQRERVKMSGVQYSNIEKLYD